MSSSSHPADPEFSQADYATVLDSLTHDPSTGDNSAQEGDIHTPTDHAVHHAWLRRIVPGIETLAAKYHLGNWVVDKKTGERKWESMPIYVRVGMQMLYHGKEQEKLLSGTRLEAFLKAQSEKQGKAFDSPNQAFEHIQAFVKTYNINCEELEKPNLADYPTFNSFFYRKLRPNARPPSSPSDPSVLSSSADCRLTVYSSVDKAKEFWIKDQNFTVESLLQDEGLAKGFENASMAIFRLAPADYHRYHSPVNAVVGETKHIEGQYYTVNPCAVNENLPVFTANKRDVTLLSMPREGDVPLDLAFVQIGAMLVGSIVQTAQQGQQVKRGDELGYFAYGGSTIVLLVPKDRVKWDEDLIKNSENKLETSVKVGEQIGRFV
ncbi:uncharacterized protein JCM6883_004428 [Sporobolomyces salmoneus]|uniref:uncharacterized protein n=1 Tax=Sporobolomyces salmoneus TaxID=183962 RepID=UPI0031801B56